MSSCYWYSLHHWYKHHPISRFKRGTKAPEVGCPVFVHLLNPRSTASYYFRSDCLVLGSPHQLTWSLFSMLHSMCFFLSFIDHKSLNVHTHFFLKSCLGIPFEVQWSRKKCVPHILREEGFSLPEEGSVQNNLSEKLRKPCLTLRPLRLLLALQQGGICLFRSVLCLTKIIWTTSDTRYRQTLQYSQLDLPEMHIVFQANEIRAWQFSLSWNN